MLMLTILTLCVAIVTDYCNGSCSWLMYICLYVYNLTTHEQL